MQVNVDPKVLQMLNWIFDPSIALDLRDLEFLGQLLLSHLSSERSTSAHQESVYRSSFALVLLLHLPSHVGTPPFQLSDLPVQIHEMTSVTGLLELVNVFPLLSLFNLI
jgi:hypothetical protein